MWALHSILVNYSMPIFFRADIIFVWFCLDFVFILYKFRHQLIHKTIGSSIIDQLLDQINVEDIIQGNEKKMKIRVRRKIESTDTIGLKPGKKWNGWKQSCIRRVLMHRASHFVAATFDGCKPQVEGKTL